MPRLSMQFFGPEQHRQYFPDGDECAGQVAAWEARFADYWRHVDEIKPRLPKLAYQLFRYGFAETGLHDAKLLSFTIGDGLDFVPDGTVRFTRKCADLVARLRLLGQSGEYHHLFEMRGEIATSMDLTGDNWDGQPGDELADLNYYEIVALDDRYLQLGLWFSNDSTLIIRFRKLRYRYRRLFRHPRALIRSPFQHVDQLDRT